MTTLRNQSDAEIVTSLYLELRRFAAVAAPWDFDPDDVLHGVLVNVLGKQPLNRADDPGAYLRRAILNYVNSELRKRRTRRLTVDLIKPPPTAADPNVYPSDLDDLMHLRPTERTVLYLHDVEGSPFDEVGATIGISAANARMVASRARKKLREAFSQEDRR